MEVKDWISLCEECEAMLHSVRKELSASLSDSGYQKVSDLHDRLRSALRQPQGFVIRYTDGFYNLLEGYPVVLREATRYATLDEAKNAAEGLCDVDCIEEVI